MWFWFSAFYVLCGTGPLYLLFFLFPSCQALLDVCAHHDVSAEVKERRGLCAKTRQPIDSTSTISVSFTKAKSRCPGKKFRTEKTYSDIVSDLVILIYSSSLQYCVAQELPEPAAVSLRYNDHQKKRENIILLILPSNITIKLHYRSEMYAFHTCFLQGFK